MKFSYLNIQIYYKSYIPQGNFLLKSLSNLQEVVYAIEKCIKNALRIQILQDSETQHYWLLLNIIEKNWLVGNIRSHCYETILTCICLKACYFLPILFEVSWDNSWLFLAKLHTMNSLFELRQILRIFDTTWDIT